jgi:hypothetical protein
MKAPQVALEHIRKSINAADALRMKSSAVLVEDLKVLLVVAESVFQERATSFAEHGTSETLTPK